MELGKYLKKLRKQKGLTINQVVVKTRNEIDKTTVSRLEAGQRKLSLKAAYYLAKLYNIRLDNLAEMAIGAKPLPAEPPFHVSPEEKGMILRYRKLSPVLSVSVKNIMRNLTPDYSLRDGRLYRIHEEVAEYTAGEINLSKFEESEANSENVAEPDFPPG